MGSSPTKPSKRWRISACPLRKRLIEYFISYTRTILNNEWVRIFLYAGLPAPALNQRYLKRLHENFFLVIIEELRHQMQLPNAPTEHELALDIEVLWGFHTSFFYLGVRKWVYQLPVPENLTELITYRVNSFLDGALHCHPAPTPQAAIAISVVPPAHSDGTHRVCVSRATYWQRR
jgi:hypothetical protein